MATDKVKIIIKLVTDFHTNVKSTWTNTSDYIVKGKEWLNEISEKHQDQEISKHMQDVLFDAAFEYAKISGTVTNLQAPYYALIMKGGGIKGLAYVGALEELSKHYEFNWYAGTSAGAITAVLLGADHSIPELKNILEQKNFKDFKDAWIAKALWNLCSKQGFYEANNFLLWLNTLLAKKLNSSTEVRLVDLPKRTTVYASKRNKNAIVFDSLLPQSQETSAAFAARCSMSIPIIFTPQKSEGLNIFDGGLQHNFPVEQLLKDNPDTNFVAFYLGNETFEWKKNNVILDIFKIWTESSDTDTLRKYKENIVIIDPSPISTLQFKLTANEKEFLLEAGRLAAINFLDSKRLIDKEIHPYNYSVRKIELNKTRSQLKLKRKIRFFKRIVFSVIFLFSLIYIKTIIVGMVYLFNFFLLVLFFATNQIQFYGI